MTYLQWLRGLWPDVSFWRRLHDRRVQQWAIGLGFFAALSACVTIALGPDRYDVQAGQVAQRDIESPRRVIDQAKTDALRQQAVKQAYSQAEDDASNFVINPAAASQGEDRVAAAFDVLADALAKKVDAGDEDQLAAVQSSIVARSDVEVPLADIKNGLALTPALLERARQAAMGLVSHELKSQRIPDTGLGVARQDVHDAVGALGLTEAVATLTGDIAAGALRPNLILDAQKLEQIRTDVGRQVQPVYVERGQMIVRKGDLISAEDVSLLRDLGMLSERGDYRVFVGAVLILLLLSGTIAAYLYYYEPDLLARSSSLALLGIILIAMTLLTKVASFVPSPAAAYLIPTGLAGMLIAILLDSRLALLSVVFLSAVTAILFGPDARAAIVALAGGLAGLFSVSKVSQRSDLTRAGGVVGISVVLTMLGWGLLKQDGYLQHWFLLGLVNGVVSAAGTIGFLPYLESAFGITSSIRLLELSNPNNPLLRKLLMEAPGSYHHSMIVGNLSEAAAEAVGADPLLTRVGSQYHDIGKTKRPYFFIENQFGGENPHDKLAPTLSTLIITSHVKDGVEMARQQGLPEVIVDFIRQHHGTQLVRYFYHQALEQAKSGTVDEQDFRYAGPKPQSKETAIVMLADGVEAAVRSLNRPAPGRIEGLVHKIIKDRLADGQLDESNLTLRDLNKIADAFVRVLTGIFHNRVQYPENVLKEMEIRRRA
ncbi:MAG TPA: HDIG domain-containing protein [Limnochordia bacterium]|nr:HDIG domain-containing protein [Limnochordia bacterium]